eukprot:3678666-Pleurochrysis_carterae.AAC.1
MRRAHVAPGFRSAGFVAPPQAGAGGNACATSGDRQRARPAASKVKGTSPPSCRQRALSAVSETGVSSALDSEDSEAASFARESLLRLSFFAA